MFFHPAETTMAKHITRQASRDMAFRLANGSSKTARRIRRTPKKSQAQQVSACQPVASTWQTLGGGRLAI
jgi:hypothetical protein